MRTIIVAECVIATSLRFVFNLDTSLTRRRHMKRTISSRQISYNSDRFTI